MSFEHLIKLAKKSRTHHAHHDDDYERRPTLGQNIGRGAAMGALGAGTTGALLGGTGGAMGAQALAKYLGLKGLTGKGALLGAATGGLAGTVGGGLSGAVGGGLYHGLTRRSKSED